MSDATHRDVPTAAPVTAARSTDKNRRRFLLAFGASAAGVASASALAAAPAVVVAPADAKRESQGYRETEHVRNYYASTRL